MASLNMRKAQSALEFLTTYGWAFLVILVMIGALSYFGVLDPTKFLPDKCLFGAGIGTCREFVVGSTSIVIKVVNNFGTTVNISNTSATISGLSTICAPTILGNLSDNSATYVNISALPLWNSSQVYMINISGCTIAMGERPRVQVAITYTPQGKSFSRVVEGDVSGKRIN